MTGFVSNTNEHDASAVSQYVHRSAGFWMRFFAYLIDLLIIKVVIVGLFVNNILLVLNKENYTIMYISYTTIFSFIAFFLYFILMTKFFNQTLGKMILGLKVVRDNGEKLDWSSVIFRESVGRLFSSILYIPYVIVAFTPKNKAIHDFIADTQVIHEGSFIVKEDKATFEMEQSMKERYEEKQKENTITESSQLHDKDELK